MFGLITREKTIGALFSVLSVLVFTPTSNAVVVEYSFESGLENGTFRPRYYEDGSLARDFTYQSWFDLSGLTLRIDTENASATLDGTFAGDLKDHDDNVIGISSAELHMEFMGLSLFPTDLGDPTKPIVAIGEEGVSSSNGTYSFLLDFADDRFTQAETIDVYGGYARPNENHAKFGDLAGISFDFLLRENGEFDIWVKSSETSGPFTLFHEDFKLHGDIHAEAVPEPATVALLLSGLLGGAAARRKRS